MLRNLENILGKNSQRCGLILHIGAGRGRNIDNYIDCGFSRMVLVEADPDLARELQIKCERLPNASVLALAVTATGTPRATFNIYNDKRYNSILAPGEILQTFPNLGIESSITLDSTSLEELIARYRPSNASLNMIVIDRIGNELEVLESLPADTMKDFDYVAVFTGSEHIYTSGAASADVLKFMETHFYDSIFKCTPNAEESMVIFQLNRSCLKLTSDLAEQSRQLQELVRTQNVLSKDFESLEQENAELLDIQARLEGKLAHLKQKKGLLKSRLSQLSEEIKEQSGLRECLEKNSEKAGLAVTDLQRKLSDLENENTNLAKANKDIESKLSRASGRLENELAELKTQQADTEQQLQQQSMEKEKLAFEFSEVKAQQTDTEQQLQQQSMEKEKLAFEFSEVKAQQTDTEQQLQQQSMEREKLALELADVTSQLQAFSSSNDQLEKKIETIIERERAQKSELNASERERRLASRIAIKHQVDLEDLQKRYSEKQQREEQLVGLIMELREKLTAASGHYFSLQQQHPELLREDSDS